MKIEYVSIFFGALMLVLTFYFLYPEETKKSVLYCIITACLINIVVVTVFPAVFYTNLIPFFHIYLLFSFLYPVFIIILAFMRGKKDTLYILFGYAFCILVYVLEMFYEIGIISTDVYYPFSGINNDFLATIRIPHRLIVYIFIMAVNLFFGMRFMKLFSRSDKYKPLKIKDPQPNLKDFMITKRELEIIQYVIQGYSNREIADVCFISEGTVKIHLNNIFQKVDVKNRTELSHRFQS